MGVGEALAAGLPRRAVGARCRDRDPDQGDAQAPTVRERRLTVSRRAKARISPIETAPQPARAPLPAKVVAEHLGHASITIAMDVYSHVVPSMKSDAAELVAGLILGG